MVRFRRRHRPHQAVLAQEAVALADIGDNDEVLEPAAGTGGLVDYYLPKQRTTCVEISTLHG